MNKSNSKSKKSFADRAKYIMAHESDPKLQILALEKLSEEQEAYKAANGLNEQVQQPTQLPMSSYGGSLPQFYDGSWMEPNKPQGNFTQNGYNIGTNQNLQSYQPYIPKDSINYIPSIEEEYESYLTTKAIRDINTSAGRDIVNMQYDIKTPTGPDAFTGIERGWKNDAQRDRQNRRSEIQSLNKTGQLTTGQKLGSAAIQMAPSIISGVLSAVGNKRLSNRARKFATEMQGKYDSLKVEAPKQVAENISYKNERDTAQAQADNMMRVNQSNIKNAATSRGQYMANLVGGNTEINRNLSNVMGSSFERESNANVANRGRVASENAGYNMQAQGMNADIGARGYDAYQNWNQQANMYDQGVYGAVDKTMSDINQINMQNQMLTMMGNKYGVKRTGKWWQPNQLGYAYQGPGSNLT